MKNTESIIANIRKAAAQNILDEIVWEGSCNVANAQSCIAKVFTQLGVILIEKSPGLLVLA